MLEQNSLTNLVLEHDAIPAQFVQQRFLLDGAGVLFWPKQDILVFSDLHFEKGSFLTQFAHPLPRFDTKETLTRMRLLLSRYMPKTVICLGDSFHDGNAFQRMDSTLIDLLNQMVSETSNWIWVLGNHDPQIPPFIHGDRENDLAIENIVFAHEPCIKTLSSGQAMLFGHYHPKASSVVARHKAVGGCFVQCDKVFIMPAFGKYTGGLSVKSDVIQSLINENTAKLYLTYRKKVYLI